MALQTVVLEGAVQLPDSDVSLLEGGYEGTGSGSSGVTVNLTGVEAANDIGALVATGAALLALTAVVVAGDLGTPTPLGHALVVPSAVTAAGELGTPTPLGSALLTPTAVVAANDIGALTVDVGNLYVGITGVTAAGDLGAPTVLGHALLTPTAVVAANDIGALQAYDIIYAMPTGVVASGDFNTVLAGQGFYNGAELDGSNSYIERSATLTGAPTSTQVGTFSCWVRPDGSTGANQVLLQGIASGGSILGELVIYLANTADNELRAAILAFKKATLTLAILQSSGHFLSIGKWNHILISWDLSVPISRIYLNDHEAYVLDGYADQELTYGHTLWNIGAGNTVASPDSFLDGCLADVWFNDEYLDISVEGNRRKFVNADMTPAFLGFDGILPTGNAPLIWQRNDYTAFETNEGTGGDFAEVPTLAECAEARDATGDAYAYLAGLGVEAGGDFNTVLADQQFYDGADFDGSAARIERTAALSGAPSSTRVGTISMWVRPSSHAAIEVLFQIVDADNNEEGSMICGLTSGSTEPYFAFIAYETGTSNYAAFIASRNHLNLDVWNHVVFSWDTENDYLHLYINDFESLDAASLTQDYVMKYDHPNIIIGGGGTPGNEDFWYEGCLADVWFTDEYIDLSVEGNRRKFINADLTPAFLGFDGIYPTGNAPLIWQRREYSTFEDNEGAGGDFTETGTLTVCSDPREASAFVYLYDSYAATAAGDLGVVIVSTGTGGVTVVPVAVLAANDIGTLQALGSALLTPTAVTMAGDLGTPTVLGSALLTPSAVTAAGDLGAPTILTSALLTPSAVTAAGDLGALQALGSALITPTAATVAGEVGILVVSLDGTVVVVPASVLASGDLGTPTVLGSALLTPPATTAAGDLGLLQALGSALVEADGVEVSGVPDELTVIGNALLVPTGVVAAGQLGTLATLFDVSFPITGVAMAGQVGAVYINLQTLAHPTVDAIRRSAIVTAIGAGAEAAITATGGTTGVVAIQPEDPEVST